jgi:hypothetical protein
MVVGKVWGSAMEGVADLRTIYLQVKSKAKPHWAMNRHLNNEGQECKTGCVKGRALVWGEG